MRRPPPPLPPLRGPEKKHQLRELREKAELWLYTPDIATVPEFGRMRAVLGDLATLSPPGAGGSRSVAGDAPSMERAALPSADTVKRLSATTAGAEVQRLLRNLGAHAEVLGVLELRLPLATAAGRMLLRACHHFLQQVRRQRPSAVLYVGRGLTDGARG